MLQCGQKCAETAFFVRIICLIKIYKKLLTLTLRNSVYFLRGDKIENAD